MKESPPAVGADQRVRPPRPAGLRRLALRAAALFLLAFALWVVTGARFERPAPTPLLRDRHAAFLAEAAAPDQDRGFWPLTALPERVVAATLAIEDRRFWDHPGVDVLAIGRALRQNLGEGERVSGASTLAMQVARLQRPGSRTYLRKTAEALTALLLTARYGREAVLTQYLTLVPYGNRIHGIAYAARRYLDKPVEDLSWAEIAFLTAIPQSPARMNPFDPLGKARAIARGQRILAALATSGVITAEEEAVAREGILRLAVPPRGERSEDVLHAVLHLGETLAAGARPRGEAPPLLFETTLDLDLQKEITRRARFTVNEWQRLGAGNAAVLVVERASGEVLAAVSSTGYFDAEHAGAIDYLRVPRLAGSTLKPFVYALGLERGRITPLTHLDDLEPAVGGIVNADDRYLGPMLPRFALGNSRNVPAVNLLAELGVEEGFALLGDLGLHDGRATADRYGVGLALGGMPVTLEGLVTAYTALAGDGRVRPLVWRRGEAGVPGRRVLSEDTARQITLFLADPQARLPSFPRMGHSEYPFPVAVKTGTSSQFRDAWTVAWSDRYLVGAWVGHPDYRPMHEASGFRAAAGLVQAILLSLHRDQLQGLADLSFPPPRGWRAERVCALSGQRAGAACDRVLVEWLSPAQLPPPECRFHRQVAVDLEGGRVALATYVDLPPRYAAWAMREGLVAGPAARGELGYGPVGPNPAYAMVGPNRASALRLTITSPRGGERLLLDPEAPAAASSLALRVTAAGGAEQVVWYVDGHPWATVDRPFTARWPLQPGEHSFEARLPFANVRSRRVTVVVE